MPIIRTIAIVLLCSLLAACGGAPAPAAPEPAAPTPTASTVDETPGTLRVAYTVWWGGAESLDPLSAVPYYEAINMLYDRLARLEAGTILRPELAETWSSNPEATVWSFTLRKGVTFHNGAPLTSADVAYSIGRLRDPQQEAVLASLYSIIERIETTDPQTVVFYLSEPHAELPILFTSYRTSIIPAASGERIGTTGIGSGPFQLEQLDATGTTRVVANRNYWRGAPGLAAIELIGIADGNARLQAFQAGQVDVIMGLSPQQAALLKSNPVFVVQELTIGNWVGLTLRTDTPPFDDVRVRRAMRLVVDRQEMLDIVNQGVGTLACDAPVWIGDPQRWQGPCAQDIEQARRLLAEAGYPDGLEVTLYTADSLPYMTPLAEVYQQQAAKAGIRVVIKQAPADSYWTEIWGVEPFFIDGEYHYPADLALHMFYDKASVFNNSHFDDPAFAQLLSEARATLDPDKRKILYQQAQQYLFEHGGTMIPFYMDIGGFRRSVAGLQLTSFVDLLWHEVKIAKE